MRKKSINKVLAAVLIFSMVILAGLAGVLWSIEKHKTASMQESNPNSIKEKNYLLAVTTKRVSVSSGTEVTPEMFIHSVESVHEVSYSYEKEPDFTKYGSQEVLVRVTDAVGNHVVVKTKLNIINLKETLEVNIGSVLPEAEEFLVEPGSKIFYVSDVSGLDMTVPQNHNIIFMVDGSYAQTTLSVDDYAAPEVTTRQVEMWLNHPMEAEEFIETVNDYSTIVDCKYISEPDWSVPGEQQVSFSVSDEKGNVAECTAALMLLEDMEAPIVSASNMDVTIGDVISYKNAVNYFDNASPLEELNLQVDNTKVNLNQIGSYDVTYTVTDFVGNSTSVVAKVNVVEVKPLWNEEELLKEKALSVLAELLQDNMTDYEKAEAIYNWVNKNIRFINFSEKDNYARGAYEGMFLKEGDCFVYAATSKYLLTLAGIQNLDIKKSSTNPVHYWNLVYINDGWYHFDACPNRAGVKLFLYTDADLEAFSISQGDSHVYDKSLYPEIK